MISREDLVGTVMAIDGDREVLLVDFLGEGAVGVVYRIAPLEEPSKANTVVKFFKPQAFLEMNVLHHSFRVHEELYPNHPLLLSPEERLKRLTEEMIARVLSPRFEFRVKIYRGIMETAIQGLAREYGHRYDEGQLEAD